jgi:hypothetical protein
LWRTAQRYKGHRRPRADVTLGLGVVAGVKVLRIAVVVVIIVGVFVLAVIEVVEVVAVVVVAVSVVAVSVVAVAVVVVVVVGLQGSKPAFSAKLGHMAFRTIVVHLGNSAS